MRTPEDIAAANAVVAHHSQLAADLHALVQQTVAASGDAGANGEAGRRRDALVEFLARELVPHALAEETTMYAAAADQPALETLVTAMKREHVAIIAGIDALRDATGAGGIAAAAGGVEALFDVHLEKENELILPALLDAPAASLAQLLRGMHALLGAETDPNRDPDKDAEQDAQSGGCGCGGCGCGGGSQQR
ncbi:MAG: hemerythrin domain-containing protein [Mycobacterium leprae]